MLFTYNNKNNKNIIIIIIIITTITAANTPSQFFVNFENILNDVRDTLAKAKMCESNLWAYKPKLGQFQLQTVITKKNGTG